MHPASRNRASICKAFYPRLVALSFLMTAPLWLLLACEWPISTDLLAYATEMRLFSAQFWTGELYPRWLSHANAGFGCPVFLFYSPLVFYVLSLFEFLAPLDPNGFGRIFIGLCGFVIVAGVTSYRWLKQTLPAETAQAGALLYAGFPYFLLHIYGSFAITQLWAVALFPFLMEAAENMVQKSWRAVPKLSIAYAMMAFTHLPSLVMFSPLPWLYVAVFAPAGGKFRAIAAATTAGFLSLALSAIYWLPATLNKPFIATEHFLDSNLVYSNDFLDAYSRIGLVAVVLPLMVLFFEMPKSARRASLTPHVRFWLAVEAGLLFMTMPLSRPVWDAITPLHYLQFPFRFFLAMIPGAVFIALHWLPHTKNRNMYHILFAIGLIGAFLYSGQVDFFTKRSPGAAILDNNLLDRPEYQTPWMQKHDVDFQRKVPERFQTLPPAAFITGSGEAAITAQDSRHIMLHATVTTPEAEIALHRFYFPGWVAAPPAEISEHDSLLALHLKKGSHEIALSLLWFAGERAGMATSTAAFLILLAWAACSRLQGRGNGRITAAS